jgi:hypothetical protein
MAYSSSLILRGTVQSGADQVKNGLEWPVTTGGTRQVQYKPEAGEAGWVLRKDRVFDY